MTFHKKLGKETGEKESHTTPLGVTNNFTSSGIFSKLKNQVLLNPRSKLRLSHDILREKVSNLGFKQ